MIIKEESFYKEIKIGLPNYSNITVGYGMKVESEKGETIDRDQCWDIVNQELSVQSDGVDPSWIITKEYRKFFKTIIKTLKRNDEKLKE